MASFFRGSECFDERWRALDRWKAGPARMGRSAGVSTEGASLPDYKLLKAIMRVAQGSAFLLAKERSPKVERSADSNKCCLLLVYQEYLYCYSVTDSGERIGRYVILTNFPALEAVWNLWGRLKNSRMRHHERFFWLVVLTKLTPPWAFCNQHSTNDDFLTQHNSQDVKTHLLHLYKHYFFWSNALLPLPVDSYGAPGTVFKSWASPSKRLQRYPKIPLVVFLCGTDTFPSFYAL